ncbi:hypothetical protein SLEP1_g16690 [Rubroshorea leprosula]|uniref:Uncharacterized protein n=1 Tax=Rubroshorea leprosula TaxID=152421 RepID=A0AAV5IRM3_9ROSI|nr:hypothetical protein SLEP1_g16690 [Rubroshorea leprosula]
MPPALPQPAVQFLLANSASVLANSGSRVTVHVGSLFTGITGYCSHPEGQQLTGI